MKTSFLILTAVALCLFGLSALRAGAPPSPSPYNTKVEYHEKVPLGFPDFTLVYEGETKSTPPKGLHPWSIYHFVLTSKGKEQKITWSAGTGDIGPTQFEVGKHKFLLELKRSDTLGKLKDGELVVRDSGASQ